MIHPVHKTDAGLERTVFKTRTGIGQFKGKFRTNLLYLLHDIRIALACSSRFLRFKIHLQELVASDTIIEDVKEDGLPPVLEHPGTDRHW